jgi:tetratricopeptide (TPR) repeat protein/TolB-like protein
MADILDRLTHALADRYQIERELGSGGMATVYLAQDLKHERQVAVKVLRPELAAALGADRFHQEIKIAANLHHPHILPLYDSGEADGFLYYVMPYEEGQSLRDKLAKEGELPITEAVRILRDVVDALDHAHKHGVVHRDIKPDNVLLSERHALVTDFGVAKAVSEATGAHKLTTEGVALGTPAYMSPEQATADKHIDHRADVYAVGAVAYELLTGRTPFVGTTQQEVLSAHVTQTPDPVTEHRETVPPALAQLVMKCLEKKPADRWQSAEELLPQLEALATPSGGITPTGRIPVDRLAKRRWMMAGGTVAVAAIIAVIAVVAALPGGGAVTLKPNRVVVAPFEAIADTDTLASLGAIVAHYVTEELSRTGIVEIVPTVETQAALSGIGAGSTADLAVRTGAAILISGMYFFRGDSILLRAQLVDARESRVLGDVGPVGDEVEHQMLAVDQLRQRIAGLLSVHLDPCFAASAQVAGQPPSFEAYQHFMTGMQLRREARATEALKWFDRALNVDSTFASARLWMAGTEWNVGNVARADSLFREVEVDRGRLAPLEAALLDGAQAWLAMDLEAALRAYRRMCQLDPIEGCRFAAQVAVWSNRPQEAIEHLMRARERYAAVGGFSPFYWRQLTTARHILGDYRQELRDARQARRHHPDSRITEGLELRALAAVGELNELRERVDEILTSETDVWTRVRPAVVALRAHGHQELSLQVIEQAIEWQSSLAQARQRELQEDRADALRYAERWVDAKVLLDSGRIEDPDNIGVLGKQGTLAVRLGMGDEAEQIDDELTAIAERPYTFGNPTFWRAKIAALLGEKDQAVMLLRQAAEETCCFSQLPLHDIDLEPLRDYAPFQELMRPKG